MIVYATHAGGRYLQVADSLKEQPEGKRGIYVNLTNKCNCACTFCLRNMKKMAEESSLWLKEKPTVEAFKEALDEACGKETGHMYVYNVLKRHGWKKKKYLIIIWINLIIKIMTI